MSVSCESYLLSGRGLCDGPIISAEPTECDVSECDLETSKPQRRGGLGPLGTGAPETKKKYAYTYLVPLSLYVASSHQNLKLIPCRCVLETLRRTPQR